MRANTWRAGWEAAELRLGAPSLGAAHVSHGAPAGVDSGLHGPALPQPTPRSADTTGTRRHA